MELSVKARLIPSGVLIFPMNVRAYKSGTLHDASIQSLVFGLTDEP